MSSNSNAGVRKKSLQACKSCRLAKRKCDSVRPICGACLKKSVSGHCVYETPENKGSRTAMRMEMLQQRITQLESTRDLFNPHVASQSYQIQNISEPIPSVSPAGQSLSTTTSELPYLADLEPATNDAITTPHQRERYTLTDDEIGVATPRYGFFGSSSALGFMSQLRSAVGDSIPQQEDAAQSSMAELVGDSDNAVEVRRNSEIQPLSRPNCSYHFDYAVPPRNLADKLLDIYWNWVHIIHPWLDKESFLHEYERIWQPASPNSIPPQPRPEGAGLSPESASADTNKVKKLFFCTLNVVLALACQFDESLDIYERRLKSDIFWKRAKSLLELDFDVFNEGSLKLIQVTLLSGLYLQSTELSGACWNLIGASIRIGQSLGLHDCTDYVGEHHDFPQREIKRRLWAGCVLLDRNLSTIYGRPSMISSRLSASALFPTKPARPSTPLDIEALDQLDFTRHELDLCDILGEILDEFYERRAPLRRSDHFQAQPRHEGSDTKVSTCARRLSTESFQSLIKLDAALAEWNSRLPCVLKTRDKEHSRTLFSNERMSPEDPFCNSMEIIKRQATVLHVRHLHVRLLLSRPMLLGVLCGLQEQRGALAPPHEELTALQWSLMSQVAETCLSSAQELVKNLTSDKDRDCGLLPEWWCTIVYLYNSGIALIVGRLCAASLNGINVESLAHSWKDCRNSLMKYARVSRSARRCCEILDAINRQMWDKPRGTACNSIHVTRPETVDSLGDNQWYMPTDARPPTQNHLDGEHPTVTSGPDPTSELVFHFDPADDLNLDFELLSSLPFELQF